MKKKRAHKVSPFVEVSQSGVNPFSLLEDISSGNNDLYETKDSYTFDFVEGSQDEVNNPSSPEDMFIPTWDSDENPYESDESDIPSELTEVELRTLKKYFSLNEDDPARDSILCSASQALLITLIGIEDGQYNLNQILLSGSSPESIDSIETVKEETSPGFFAAPKHPIKGSERGLVVGRSPTLSEHVRKLRSSKPRLKFAHRRFRSCVKILLSRIKKDKDRFCLAQNYLIGQVIQFTESFPFGLEKYSTYHGSGYFQICRRLPSNLLIETLKCLSFKKSTVHISELETLTNCQHCLPRNGVRKIVDGTYSFISLTP